MKAYKWMTEDMKAFFDGYQFKFGWNIQDGNKDGQVCVSGGFHLSRDFEGMSYVQGGKYHPDKKSLCFEVKYLKKDILGEDTNKIRVRAFKLLKKKPIPVGIPSKLWHINLADCSSITTNTSTFSATSATIFFTGGI